MNFIQQKQYGAILTEYVERIQNADRVHAKKFEAMRDSAKFLRQTMPEISKAKMNSSDAIEGNNVSTTNEESAGRSMYTPTIMLAIKKKVLEDLNSEQIDFEYASNKNGMEKADAFMSIIQRAFSQENVMVEHYHALEMLWQRGTIIAQPITSNMSRKIVVDSANEETGEYEKKPIELKSGRYVGFYSYDPLTTLIDPNADPHKAQKTAEWATITIGYKSANYIEQKYGVKVDKIISKNQDSYSGGTVTSTYLTIDSHKIELEAAAGLENRSGYLIREYYLTNGKVYTILEDCYVLNEKYNSACIYGMIPIIICPAIVDNESPYGIPPCEELRPSVEVLATAINAVADNTALRNKLPFVTPKGFIDPDTLEAFKTGDYNDFNSIIEVNLARVLGANPGVNIRSLKELFVKPDVQEVTPGSMFLFQQALNDIYTLSGMNDAVLAGRQEKQIRIQSVADMINASSVKSSSQLIRNIETYYINVLCQSFQGIFYAKYDDFKNEFTLKDNVVIERETIANLQDIRVVKGSYLPSDQMTRMQRASFIAGRANVNPYGIDPVKAEKYLFKSMGYNLEDFERDPMQRFDEEQVIALLELASKAGPEGMVQQLGQMKQQMEAQKNEKVNQR